MREEFERCLEEVRRLGVTPESYVASDLASRVEGIVGPPGVAGLIRELDEGDREKLALDVAKAILDGRLGVMAPEAAAGKALRAALAVLTEGCVSAPVEGLEGVRIKTDERGRRHLSLSIASPIRSAGGTAAAFLLVAADRVREWLSLEPYRMGEEEMGRLTVEVEVYEMEHAHLQYRPPPEQLAEVRNLTVEVTGEEAGGVRPGPVLLICEGLMQKAPKLLKHVRRLGIKGWEWLERVVPRGEKGERYLEEVLAGRPVFAHPGKEGGFRLRYGRARNTGLSAVGLHPATMELLGLGVGTQLKLEWPGKGGAVAPVDSLDPPTVRMRSGEEVRLGSGVPLEEVEEVLDLGEILVSLGDCIENNAVLRKEGSPIGARMGRPEKACPRLMDPPPHVLFPVGERGGPQRLLNLAFPEELEREAEALGLEEVPAVKGVKGLVNPEGKGEGMALGILRARHGVHVFRDGTCRFDATNLPLTHFRPGEVGTPPERLRELGYEAEDGDTLLELRVQDVVLPEEAGDFLVRVAGFVDDHLRLLGGKPFYGAERREDLVGHLVVCLSPHTSVGVVGRIVGFTPTSVLYAHPFFHAAKRRDCDGDADAVMLLMDVLLHFRREFLSPRPGGRMDVPLLLLPEVDPREVDKAAHNMEAEDRYPPLQEGRPAVEAGVRTVGKVLKEGGRPRVGVTVGTGTLAGPRRCRYSELGSMEEKLGRQMELAEKIRAVDAGDVALRVLEHHLIPDLKGNLRKYGTQRFRCTACGRKYRWPPLRGACPCGGNVVMTVPVSGVRKYLSLAKGLAERYGVDGYVRSNLSQIEEGVRAVARGEVRQVTLLELAEG